MKKFLAGDEKALAQAWMCTDIPNEVEKAYAVFKELPKDEGMLFTNFEDDSPWFHMKNVGIDLDLIGLDDEMKVIKVIRGKADDPTPL